MGVSSKIHDFQALASHEIHLVASHELNLVLNIGITLVSCVIYLLLLIVVSPKLSNRMSLVYRTMTEGQKLDWNAR